MRRILVDYARARRYSKRGGGVQPLSLDEAVVVSREKCRELLALDEALDSLAAFDPRKSQVAELRFFGGTSVEETAEVLKVSPRTVMALTVADDSRKPTALHRASVASRSSRPRSPSPPPAHHDDLKIAAGALGPRRLPSLFPASNR
jgi:hypothetical protein